MTVQENEDFQVLISDFLKYKNLFILRGCLLYYFLLF